MSAPPCFDPRVYAHLYAHEWAIDLRHAQILFAVCALARPRYVVEIGSHRGASTAAFVEAIRAGYVEELHCFEPNPPVELGEVLHRIPRARGPEERPRWHLHRHGFRGALWGGRGDCLAFIDGDHGAQALNDLEPFLRSRVSIIALHDTNAVAAGYPSAWGAVAAGVRLRQGPDPYSIAHDQEKRAGERTERGLTVGFLCDDFLADAVQTLMHRPAPWWAQPLDAA